MRARTLVHRLPCHRPVLPRRLPLPARPPYPGPVRGASDRAERTVPMKAQRQRAIVEVVEREEIWSQDMLGQRLRARGFDVTQATLSRDIKELGLVKRAADGAYQRPGQPANGAPAEAAVAALRRACREVLAFVRAGAAHAGIEDRYRHGQQSRRRARSGLACRKWPGRSRATTRSWSSRASRGWRARWSGSSRSGPASRAADHSLTSRLTR